MVKRKKARSARGHKKRLVLATAAVCLCGVLAAAGLMYRNQRKQMQMQVSAANSHDTGSGYRDIIYEGKHYRYNSLIKTVLYAGVDGTGKMEASAQYGNKDRADTISLVVLDKKHAKMTILPISRDTMTEIRRYSMSGNDNGLYTSHIGYAYSYGDGGKASCENLCEAVSNLLGGVPVKEYVVTNQDSMPYINDLAGGITLTVPNDDLSGQYPELTKGAKVTLNDGNIRAYLQYRDTEEDFSNDGRMERQKAYVTAYIEKIQQMDSSELADTWEALDDMEEYLQTSITRSEYLDLMELVRTAGFSDESFAAIAGEDQQGELHDEFHPDEEALEKLVIELFYNEV